MRGRVSLAYNQNEIEMIETMRAHLANNISSIRVFERSNEIKSKAWGFSFPFFPLRLLLSPKKNNTGEIV